MTNFEFIKEHTKTVEDMAFLCSRNCPPGQSECDSYCYECWLAWLKKEYENQ